MKSESSLNRRKIRTKIGLLLIAKKKGIIIEVKPILDQFLSQGKRISPILYQEILGMAEES
ncbi:MULTISPECIES: DUF3368 domain-containing protein [unclassified Microcystis]|uniref:DUF3368 domain-containing protein n=1 Tax=unclassified Microcystis TaxID=2643300 RepID=UPI0031FC3C92